MPTPKPRHVLRNRFSLEVQPLAAPIRRPPVSQQRRQILGMRVITYFHLIDFLEPSLPFEISSCVPVTSTLQRADLIYAVDQKLTYVRNLSVVLEYDVSAEYSLNFRHSGSSKRQLALHSSSNRPHSIMPSHLEKIVFEALPVIALKIVV